MLFLAMALGGSFLSNSQSSDKTKIYSILFVGNSLTYYNNLPALVEQKAKKSALNIKTEMLAKPNYAIIDHWEEGNVQSLISEHKYDYVIIQQGPSSQDEGKEILIHSGKQYSKLCKANGTTLVYFMVWPSLKYYHTFPQVIANHELAAKLNNALLCPVGKTWKEHFDVSKDFTYYSEDGFHPSVKGSNSAAKVIVETLLKDILK